MDRILLTSPDEAYATLLAEAINAKGFRVDILTNTQLMIERLQEQTYSLAIVDCATQHATALQLVQDFREYDEWLPILVMGMRREKEDIRAAYIAGADEYIVKPFASDTLLCKIESWLRRPHLMLKSQNTVFEIGAYRFDTQSQTLTYKEESRHLSVRENEVLEILADHQNEVVERRLILRRIWHTDSYYAQRSLSVYITHLKHYLEGDERITIKALRGRGYKLIVNK